MKKNSFLFLVVLLVITMSAGIVPISLPEAYASSKSAVLNGNFFTIY